MKKTYIIPCITDEVIYSMALPIAGSGDQTQDPHNPYEPGDGDDLVKRSNSIWDEEW